MNRPGDEFPAVTSTAGRVLVLPPLLTCATHLASGALLLPVPEHSLRPVVSVHVDDLKRNFSMNPTCGIQCTPFDRKKSGAGADRELVDIGTYLMHIAASGEDFEKFDHVDWRAGLVRFQQGKGPGKRSAE